MKRSVLFLIVFIVLAALAFADQLGNAQYDLYGDPSAAGGRRLENNDHILYDAKGQPFGGTFQNNDYDLKTGITPLVVATTTTTTTTTIPVPGVLIDDGWIRQTNITREGEDLKLTWDYDPARGETNVNIYVQSGAAVEYSANAGGFVGLASVPLGTKTYVHSNGAHDGNNYYYRVVPDPVIPGTDILDPQNNSITAGKVEIAVPANKYDFVALPFMEDVYYLSAVIGEQLGDGAEYYFWDTATQTNPGASYAAGQWGGSSRGLNTPLRMGDGFYVRARSAKALALVGRFGRLSAPLERTLVPKNNYNLIAFPYPASSTLADMGLRLEPAADIYEWTDYAAYKGSTYLSDQSGWSVTGIDSVQLARPRFYRPISNLTWEINP